MLAATFLATFVIIDLANNTRTRESIEVEVHATNTARMTDVGQLAAASAKAAFLEAKNADQQGPVTHQAYLSSLVGLTVKDI